MRIRGALLWFGLLLVLWQTAALRGLVSPMILPSLGSIFQAAHGPELALAVLRSLGFVFAGMAVGSGAAFVLAALAFRKRGAGSLTAMLCAVFHPLPGIALMPVFILFFGIGRFTLLAVILHSVIWPLTVNLSAGFQSVPPVYRKAGQNLGLGGLSLFFRIMLPSSFPHILSGLKTAWARAWRAAVSAEMVFGISGEEGGLGWFVYKNRIFMDTSGMYAGIFVLALLGILIESGVFTFVENRTLQRWEGAL